MSQYMLRFQELLVAPAAAKLTKCKTPQVKLTTLGCILSNCYWAYKVIMIMSWCSDACSMCVQPDMQRRVLYQGVHVSSEQYTRYIGLHAAVFRRGHYVFNMPWLCVCRTRLWQ